MSKPTTDPNVEIVFDLKDVTPAPADILLGVKYTYASNKKVIAEMEITTKHTQPMNILHGGITCVLVESVGSVASNLANLVPNTTAMVGQNLTANHLKSAMVGDTIVATAQPIHLGKSSHLWDIVVTSKKYGYMICKATLSTHVMKLDPKKHKQEFLAGASAPTTTTTTSPSSSNSSKDGTKSLNGKANTNTSTNVAREMANKTHKIPHKVTQQLPDGSYPIPACL